MNTSRLQNNGGDGGDDGSGGDGSGGSCLLKPVSTTRTPNKPRKISLGS